MLDDDNGHGQQNEAGGHRVHHNAAATNTTTQLLPTRGYCEPELRMVSYRIQEAFERSKPSATSRTG